MARPLITALIVLVVLAAVGAGVYFSASTSAQSDPAAVSSDRSADGSSAAITVQDDMGTMFTFDRPTQRIAALSAFAVEILMAMDVTPVARFEDADLYPPAAEPIPVVGRSHDTGPNIEQLIAADPDLVLLHWVYRGDAENVSKLVGCPVMVLNITDLDRVGAMFELLGEVVGKPQQADKLVADLDRTRSWLEDFQPTGADRPRVLSLLGQEDVWFAHRDNHFVGSMLSATKAQNIAGQDEAHSRFRSLTPIDLEQVIAKDPEVIFIMPYGESIKQVVLDNFNNHPATQSLAAVRNGRVHVLPYTMSSQPGPRSGQALRDLFKLLYPDQPGPPQ